MLNVCDTSAALLHDDHERDDWSTRDSYYVELPFISAARFDLAYKDGLLFGASDDEVYPPFSFKEDRAASGFALTVPRPESDEADNSQPHPSPAGTADSPPESASLDTMDATKAADGRHPVATPSAGELSASEGVLGSGELPLPGVDDCHALESQASLAVARGMVASHSAPPTVAKREGKRKRGAEDEGEGEAGPSTKARFSGTIRRHIL